MLQSPRLIHHLHLHLIVFMWGFSSILGALITVPALQLVVLRCLLAGLAWVLLLVLQGQRLGMARPLLWQVLGAGALIGVHWLTFFASARVGNISTCLAGLATTAFFTSLLDPLIRRQPFRQADAALGLLVVLGLWLVVAGATDKLAGLALALVSALASAVFSIINADFIQKESAGRLTMVEMLGATAFLGLAMLLLPAGTGQLGGTWVAPTAMDWAYLGILALVCTVYNFAASLHLMRYFSPFAMNLTINLEPVYGIVLAALIFGEKEHMGPTFYVGTAIILLAVLLHPWLARRRPSPTLP